MAKSQKTDKAACARRSGCAQVMNQKCLKSCPHTPVYSSKTWKVRTNHGTTKCGKMLPSKKTFKVAKTCTKTTTNGKGLTCCQTKA